MLQWKESTKRLVARKEAQLVRLKKPITPPRLVTP